jgi:hypothetical protein
MRRRISHALAAVAAAGVALASVGFAGVANAAVRAPRPMGPPVYNRDVAGYWISGGHWFRFLSTTVVVPPRTLHGWSAGYAGIALQHAKPTAWPGAGITVGADGGKGSVTWYAYPRPRRGVGTFTVSPRAGDRLTISIYYDQHGHDFLTASDQTTGVKQTIRVRVGAVIYDLARLGGGTASTVSAPPAGLLMWAFTDSRLATYSGQRGTLLGPWTTRKVVATATGLAGAKPKTSPSEPWNNGQNFGVWLCRR